MSEGLRTHQDRAGEIPSKTTGEEIRPDDLDDDNEEMPQSEVTTVVSESESQDTFASEEEDLKLQAVRKEARETQTTDSVRTYLKEIGTIALLSAEDEVELSKRIEAGLFAEQILTVRTKDKDPERFDTLRESLEMRGKSSQVKNPKKPSDVAMRAADADLARMQAIADSTRKYTNRDLGLLVRDGERAKSDMTEANLRLAVSLAKRYTGRGMLFLDLIQEGNLGLIRAVEKFDYTKGYKFSTYATWWIRQNITRGMADQARTIRVPVHMVEVINKQGRIEREMRQELGREPTDEELAHELDTTPEKVQEIRKYSREPISLDQEVGGDGDSQLGDFIEDEQADIADDMANYKLLQKQLRTVLATLGKREAEIIKYRYGLENDQPKTLDDIGQIYGLSRERIRQIERDVMKKLRHPSRSKVLRDYLGD